MAKLNRDEELYQLVKPVIGNFRFEDSKPGEDIESILRNKIRYDSLRQRVSWVDESLLTDKDRIRELISAKEESAFYDLGFLDIEIAKNPTLNRRLADIGLSRIHDEKEKKRLGKLWAKGQLSTGTLFFDDFLTEERTNRTVKGKDGKTYQRSGTKEAILNDRLRQLSDAVYPDIEDTVNDLREAYVDVTGMEAKNYKIPGTTYLRESVVLRTKIGKALVEKEDFTSDFRNVDPNYQYRFLADRWMLQKDSNNFVLRDFLQKQLNLATGDKAVLESYKEVAQRLKQEGRLTGDIKISDKLSVRDQIQQYRKALSGNVYDIVDVMPKSSPVYLDLVTSQKNSNPDLYKATIKELSDEKVSSLPRQMFEDINKYRSEEKLRLFSSSVSQKEFSEAWKNKGWVRRLVDYREVQKRDGTTVRIPNGITKFNDNYYRNSIDDDALARARDQETSRLLGMSFDDFNKEYQSSGEVRSLFPRTEVTDTNNNPVTSNGKPVTKPKGLTRFNGFWYRDSVDQKKLEEDFSTFIGDSKEKISAAKQKIISAKESRIKQLQKDIKDRKEKNIDSSKKEELLNKLTERLDNVKNKDYSYDSVGSLDKRAAIIKATADELTVKANIMSFDPAFNFNKVLQGVSKENRISTLNTAVRDVLRDYSAVESFVTRYQQQEFTVPSDLSVMSLEGQLSWYRNADTLMSNISSMDRNAFVSWMSGQKYGTLSKQLRVGYLQRINGQVFRSVEDADIIADLNKKEELRKQKEERILAGPAAREKPQQLGAFGNLLNKKVSVNGAALNRVSSLASDFSSEKYAALSDDEKKLFDRNFGKPVKEGNTYYRSIYDMPSDVWKRSEKAAGYDVPRSRNGVMPADFDIRVAEEEAFQKKLTEDLAARTWEPVKVAKSDKPSVPAPTEEPKVVTEEKIVQQETKSNLRKMLSSANKTVRRNSIGTMGLLSALTLFNSAMAGPSDEAVAHKRKVEEERRIKMYGY